MAVRFHCDVCNQIIDDEAPALTFVTITAGVLRRSDKVADYFRTGVSVCGLSCLRAWVLEHAPNLLGAEDDGRAI